MNYNYIPSWPCPKGCGTDIASLPDDKGLFILTEPTSLYTVADTALGMQLMPVRRVHDCGKEEAKDNG